MVQIYRGGADLRKQASAELAKSLGMGLGEGVSTYFAGKAIDDVVNNKENQDLPPSERMSKLEQALRPYGEQGQKLLMNRVALEQQRQQEEQSAKKQQADLAAQQRLFQQQKELQLLKNEGRAAPGGVGAQPIPPEIMQRIPAILNANKESNAEDLALAFDEANVPYSHYKKYVDSRALLDVAKTKNQPGQEYAKKRENTIESYVTDALRSGEEAANMNLTMDTIESALQGKVTEPGLMATLKHDPYGQLFFGLTPDEATLTTANKYMLEGTKGIWGSKPTEREMFTLLNGMLPSIGKTKEANLAGLQVIKRANQLKEMRSEIVDELTEGGKNYVSDIESQVNKLMKPKIDEFRKDAQKLKSDLENSEKVQKTMQSQGKIRVKSPDGRNGYMTQQQIDAAKAKNVIFTPI